MLKTHVISLWFLQLVRSNPDSGRPHVAFGWCVLNLADWVVHVARVERLVMGLLRHCWAHRQGLLCLASIHTLISLQVAADSAFEDSTFARCLPSQLQKSKPTPASLFMVVLEDLCCPFLVSTSSLRRA